MSSAAPKTVLAGLQLNDYTSLVVLTAVAYDYVLTLSDEVEYIWAKPWTWVSLLFVLVRYAGASGIILNTLLGNSFLSPAQQKMRAVTQVPPPCLTLNHFPGKILSIIVGWLFFLFLCAADLVMMLRVWVMYGRSRLILGILVVSLSLEVISSVIAYALISDPRKMMEVTLPVLDLPLCSGELVTSAPSLVVLINVAQMVHGSILCVLAIAQFVRQSVRMYLATKQLQINRYVNTFVTQGIIYFLGIFLISLLSLLPFVGVPDAGAGNMVLTSLEYVPALTLTPRFVLYLRELYARDVQIGLGRGSGSGIDSGLWMSHGHEEDVSAIVFADVEQNYGADGEDERLEGGY